MGNSENERAHIENDANPHPPQYEVHSSPPEEHALGDQLPPQYTPLPEEHERDHHETFVMAEEEHGQPPGYTAYATGAGEDEELYAVAGPPASEKRCAGGSTTEAGGTTQEVVGGSDVNVNVVGEGSAAAEHRAAFESERIFVKAVGDAPEDPADAEAALAGKPLRHLR